MSITQEYEQIRNEIGHDKYDAIDKYLDEICPRENYNQYNNELLKIMELPFEEWHKQKKILEEKYGIVFLSDVLYKNEEWEKFEKWYNKNKEKLGMNKENNNRRDNRHRALENGYVMDIGYRQGQPVALVEKNLSDKSKEYIIVFNHKIKDNKIEWEYGIYYYDDVEKAKKDFEKVLKGEKIVDTLKNEEQSGKNNQKKNGNRETR